MSHATIINADTLLSQLDNPDWVIIDCRFALNDVEAGPRAYRLEHLPGARYANLNSDLSAPVTPLTGRHPLPDPKILAKRLGAWGIGNTTQVVVYDDMGGAFAARLWWLLRWLGHHAVAVLDGGLPFWKSQNYPLTNELPTATKLHFQVTLDSQMMLSASAVQALMAQQGICLLDARAAVRYRGEQEPIDPVAGHVPGALNRPQQDNLDQQLRFRSQQDLRAEFLQLLHAYTPEQTVHMCGSGVTACHNLIAMEYAGLSSSKLYAGSWSEWIRDPNRPLIRG